MATSVIVAALVWPRKKSMRTNSAQKKDENVCSNKGRVRNERRLLLFECVQWFALLLQS